MVIFHRRHIWLLARIAVGVALFVYLTKSGAIQWSALQGLAAAWPLTLAALAVLFLDIVITAGRLCVLMKPRGLKLSLTSSVRLALIGNFFNTCLPGATGGDAVKILYAVRENRGRRVEIATVFLLDRFIGMFALLIFPILVAPFFWNAIRESATTMSLLSAAAVTALAMIVAMLASFSTALRNHRWTRQLLSNAPFGHHLERMIDTVRAYRQAPDVLIKATLISLMAHTSAVIVVLLLVQAVSSSGANPLMLLLIPLGLLANTLPLTPGGLGVGEAAMEQLFGMFNLSGGAEALIGWRLLVLVTGLIGLVYFIRGQVSFVHGGPSESSFADTDEPSESPGQNVQGRLESYASAS